MVRGGGHAEGPEESEEPVLRAAVEGDERGAEEGCEGPHDEYVPITAGAVARAVPQEVVRETDAVQSADVVDFEGSEVGL